MILKHSKRSFMLVVVLLLMSLAVVAEMLAARHLGNLRRHVHQRQQIVQQRLYSPAALAKPKVRTTPPVRESVSVP